MYMLLVLAEYFIFNAYHGMLNCNSDTPDIAVA